MKMTGMVEPIFILAGQSNMVGRCDAADLPANFRPNPRQSSDDVAFEMCWSNDYNFGPDGHGSSDGRFHPLMCQPCPGLDSMDETFGPEMGIARSLAPRLRERGVRRARFVKFAMGSTNLHSNWNPENFTADRKPAEVGHYRTFIHFCKTALASINNDDDVDDISGSDHQQRQRQLWGMFWLQGESDSSRAKDANAYLANFGKFVESVRSDLGCDDLPVVVSPIIWHGKKVRVINDALARAGSGDSTIPYCTCIDPIDATNFGVAVQGEEAGICAGHLTAGAVCDVGERMGNSVPLPDLVASSN